MRRVRLACPIERRGGASADASGRDKRDWGGCCATRPASTPVPRDWEARHLFDGGNTATVDATGPRTVSEMLQSGLS